MQGVGLEGLAMQGVPCFTTVQLAAKLERYSQSGAQFQDIVLVSTICLQVQVLNVVLLMLSPSGLGPAY